MCLQMLGTMGQKSCVYLYTGDTVNTGTVISTRDIPVLSQQLHFTLSTTCVEHIMCNCPWNSVQYWNSFAEEFQ